MAPKPVKTSKPVRKPVKKPMKSGAKGAKKPVKKPMKSGAKGANTEFPSTPIWPAKDSEWKLHTRDYKILEEPMASRIREFFGNDTNYFALVNGIKPYWYPVKKAMKASMKASMKSMKAMKAMKA